MSKRLLREFILEVEARIGGLGSRNLHTLNNDPFDFKDFPDYDVEISPDVKDAYALTIYYKGEKMGYTTRHSTHDEANHQARMIIDKHRVTAHQDE